MRIVSNEEYWKTKPGFNLKDYAYLKDKYGIEFINLTSSECHDLKGIQYLKTAQESPQKGYRVKESVNSLPALMKALNHKSNLNNK